MTDERKQLLRDIAAAAKARGVSETTFGRLAVDDGKLVKRLRKGRRVWPETEQKIRAFIAKECSPAGQGATVS